MEHVHCHLDLLSVISVNTRRRGVPVISWLIRRCLLLPNIVSCNTPYHPSSQVTEAELSSFLENSFRSVSLISLKIHCSAIYHGGSFCLNALSIPLAPEWPAQTTLHRLQPMTTLTTSLNLLMHAHLTPQNAKMRDTRVFSHSIAFVTAKVSMAVCNCSKSPTLLLDLIFPTLSCKKKCTA